MLNLLPKPAETGTADSFAEEGFWPGRESAPRAGLYARVSTPDQQTLPMQLAAMRDYARKREIDSVTLWRLDCWGRSLVHLVNTFQELSSHKTGFVTLSEALVLTTPAAALLAGMLAVFAEFERDIRTFFGTA